MAELEADSVEGIAIALLDRVGDPELLSNAIESHVVPYCRLHGVDSDTILLSHVAELSEALEAAQPPRGGRADKDGAFTGSGVKDGERPGPDAEGSSSHARLLELRSVHILRSIGDPSKRVDAGMLLLRAVSLPYSDDIQSLLDDLPTWPSGRQDEVSHVSF